MEIISNTIILILSALSLISLIVAIHELGHFLVARYFGVKVITFKIGFGKTLYSRFDSKGTEFAIGLIPLGGYVQMLGESGYIEGSLAMCTSLAPVIGYDKAAGIAHKASETGKTVREIAIEDNVLSEDELNKLLDPRSMTEPNS